MLLLAIIYGKDHFYMITCISGIPGSGKNVRATYLAKKHYKKENMIIKRAIRKNAFLLTSLTMFLK